MRPKRRQLRAHLAEFATLTETMSGSGGCEGEDRGVGDEDKDRNP